MIVVTFEGSTTDAEFTRFLQRLDGTTQRSFRQNTRVAFVMDTRKGHVVSAAQRRALGAWMIANDAASRATCAAFAFVIPSAIIRGALTAVLWIASMPAPHRVVPEIGEGLSYAREQLGMATPVDLSIAV